MRRTAAALLAAALTGGCAGSPTLHDPGAPGPPPWSTGEEAEQISPLPPEEEEEEFGRSGMLGSTGVR